MLCGLIYRLIIFPIRMLIAIGWWRWRIEGLENLPPRSMGGMLVVMNHIHWLDILAVGTLMPLSHRLSWLGKSELFERPFERWFFTTMQIIPIHRGRRDMLALEGCEHVLQNGAVLTVFPEGHRNHTGVLQRGLGGAVRLAVRSGVPVVPLAITGSQHGVAGALRGEELCIRIGTPYVIDLPSDREKLTVRMVNELTTDMMVRIARLLPESYRGPYQELVDGQ
ncbi:MAG: 1-acyl-sn-glycerol-3-phosphate acyltransferase [Chloroflexaceae bacterium]|nr:1-acyl-sn-glycerol-3-phosphate acyltransferase [Chloroflexaceae bacterium]